MIIGKADSRIVVTMKNIKNTRKTTRKNTYNNKYTNIHLNILKRYKKNDLFVRIQIVLVCCIY